MLIKPILLDETAQKILSAIQRIKNKLLGTSSAAVTPGSAGTSGTEPVVQDDTGRTIISALNDLGDAVPAETQYLSGVTRNIQTQLDDKVSDVQVNGSSVVSNQIANIPAADANTAGVVTTGAQTFAGSKTFTDSIITSKSGSGDSAGVQVRHSVAQADAEVLARRDDTGNGVSLLVGSGGNNRGLYNRSDTNAGWIMYLGSDGEIHFGKPVDPTNIPDASATQRGLVSTGNQTFAGVKTFKGNPRFAGGTSGGAITFASNSAPEDIAGSIQLWMTQTNGVYHTDRFYFVQRTYNSSTGEILTTNAEQYRLPAVSPDKTGTSYYNIITDKDPSTSANLLGVPNFGGYGTALKAGDNVDTDLQPGYTYYSPQASVSAALAGTPPVTNSGFKILQIRSYASSNHMYQIAFGPWNNPMIRYRGSGDTWGAWGYILDSRSPVTIAQGGTGQTGITKTSTIADIITASSAVTITSANYAQWGKVAQLTIEFKNVNAINVTATGNITDLVIGTLVAGKRPAFQLDGLLTGYSNGAGVGHGYLFANGNLGFTDFEARSAAYTIAANTTLRVFAVYILA